ncbi:thioredoxin [Patescibacteria group bacterium]|nr:thioredoxin [Patescibacteria group bacterium]
MAHTYTQDNFDAEVLQSSVPVLVDFWAPWCGPCRMTGPIIDELSAEIDEAKLKIGKVNVDEAGALAQTYNIMSIPAFLVFQNGAVVDTFVGGMTKDGFKAKLKNYLV